MLLRHIARVEIFSRELPLRAPGDPVRALDLGLEARELVQAVLARNALPVVANLGARRKLVRPVLLGLQRALVDDRRHVAAHARVDVFEPRAALTWSDSREMVGGKWTYDVGVLVEDGQLDLGDLVEQYHACCDACEAGSDNGDLDCQTVRRRE